MPTHEENPVNATVAAQLLGQPGKPWGHTRMSALKRAMGIKGRYLFVSDVRRFIRQNPNFTVDQVYPRKPYSRASKTKQTPVGRRSKNSYDYPALPPGIPDLDDAAGWARRVPYLSREKIQAMKRAGLQFSHGRLTYLKTILDWMAENPDFSTTRAYPPRVVESRANGKVSTKPKW